MAATSTADVKNFLTNSAFLGTRKDIVSNLIQGGQLGYGFKAGAFDAATPLALPPAVICVLQTPAMWDNMPDDAGGVLRQTIKSMFECHAKAVSGIDINYTLETGEQPVGHDGQNFQVPTQSKRQAVTPSFTYPEVTGNLVWNLHRRWIWDIQDPDTNAGLEHMNGVHGSAVLLPYTMTTYSLTFMAIQYDQTQEPERIIDAAVYTNVWPTTTTELGIERQIGTTSVKERAITYTGHVVHNDRTRELGVQVAKELYLRSERYRMASPNMEGVSALLSNATKLGAFETGISSDPPLSTGINWKTQNDSTSPIYRNDKSGSFWKKVQEARPPEPYVNDAAEAAKRASTGAIAAAK